MALEAAVTFPGYRRSKAGNLTNRRWLHRVVSEADLVEDMAEAGTGVQLVSDGTSEHTRLLLDGHPVGGVTDITWKFSKSKRSATLLIELRDVQIDVQADVPADVLAALALIADYNSRQ